MPAGHLGDLGLADLFFESREPENSEYPIDTLRSEFPEGDYTVGTVGHDGVARIATARFTHDIPAPVEILSPEIVEDEEAAAMAVTEAGGVVVRWAPTGETVAGDALAVTGYEVIVTKVDHDDPHGFSRPVFDVHVDAEAAELAVPASFFDPGSVYELEVLALEESGNQTITIGFFTAG